MELRTPPDHLSHAEPSDCLISASQDRSQPGAPAPAAAPCYQDG